MRGYFREWSRVVGSLGHWEASAALNACALLDLPEADENDRNNVGRALSGIAFSLGQIASDPMEERFLFVGVCAEEAIQSAADSETRAQAERTLGRAVVHGYATVKSPVERRRLVRDAIKYSLSLSTVGPAKKLRVRSRELTDVFTVLAI